MHKIYVIIFLQFFKRYKMALDATTVYELTHELNSMLIGGRIDKIFQGEKHQITLALRANKTNYKLLLSASSSYPRVHVTQNAAMNPEKPQIGRAHV